MNTNPVGSSTRQTTSTSTTACPCPPCPQATSPACSHAPLSTPNHPDHQKPATQPRCTVTLNVAEYDASLTSFTVYTNEYGESAVLTVRSARQLPIRRLVEHEPRRQPIDVPSSTNEYDQRARAPRAGRQRHRRVRSSLPTTSSQPDPKPATQLR